MAVCGDYLPLAKKKRCNANRLYVDYQIQKTNLEI